MTRPRDRGIQADPPGYVSPFYMGTWCNRRPHNAKERNRYGILKRIKAEWSRRLDTVKKGQQSESRLSRNDLLSEWCTARDKVRHYGGWD